MKRAKFTFFISCLCLFFAFNGYAQEKNPSLIIDQIFVHPGLICTKVVLQSKAPPPLFPTYYAKDSPATVVVELGQATVNANQPFPLADNLIVLDILVEVDKEGRSRLFLPLETKVPYRLYTHQNTLILELHKYQNGRTTDFVPGEVEKRLQTGVNGSGYLKNLDINQTDSAVEIKTKLSDETVIDVFALNSPYRLVADLYNVHDALRTTTFPIRENGVDKLRVSQFRASNPCPVTRMVFDLDEPRPYILTREKGKLSIVFQDYETDPAQEVQTLPAEVSEKIPKANGEDSSVPSTDPKDNKTIQDNVTGETPAENKPKERQTAADSKPEDNGINSISDNPSPPEPKEPSTGSANPYAPQTIGPTEEKYSGELVDIKIKDGDLRDVVLYLGGEVGGLNVVFDPGFRGTVTCNLVAVPWDQALDILLKNNKMGRSIDGNILRVAPMDVLTQEKQAEKIMVESKEFTEPIIIRRYPLSYAKAEEVQLLIENKLSERGEIIVDKRTNTLVISDIEDRITILEELITAFDKATPQVTIEARIVEATSTFVRNLGIQWGWRGISDPFYGNQTSLQFPNKILVDGSLIPQGVVTKGIGGALGGYAINLPAPAFSTAMGLSLSNVLDTFGLDMALTALETSGNGKVLSRPTVTTQNNVQAEIIQGKQIPVQTSANFTVTTTFVNAALELRAKPQITEEGTIIMYLEIRNNSPDFGNLVNGIPPITMQSATTTVMIPDGGTTVIGGIYQTEDSVSRDQVPFLHKIPLLGSLFKSSARTKTSRELLIFITPRIINK
jgi:type IV pilus secretin PilQ/predicted competence protein